MADTRHSFQLIDNLLLLSIVPRVKVEKNDLGLLRKEVKIINCNDLSNYGASQTTNKLTFVVKTDSCELMKDAKYRLKFTIEGTTGDYGLIDGDLRAFFKQGILSVVNGTQYNSTTKLIDIHYLMLYVKKIPQCRFKL